MAFRTRDAQAGDSRSDRDEVDFEVEIDDGRLELEIDSEEYFELD